jgi:hypothetical protein
MTLTRSQVQEAYAKMPTAYADCWDMGHQWKRGHSEPNNLGGFDRSFLCPRCTLEKVQIIDHRGYLVGTRYRNRPEGYSLTGAGYITQDIRAALRLVTSES